MSIPQCPKFGLIPSSIQEAQVALSLLGLEQVLKIPSIHMTDLNTEGKALEAHELLLKISERIMQAITQGSLPTNVKDLDVNSLVPAGALQGRQAIERAL